MTQIKDYQVNYSINVTATEGVQEVEKFAKAMKQLSDARSNFMPAVNLSLIHIYLNIHVRKRIYQGHGRQYPLHGGNRQRESYGVAV